MRRLTVVVAILAALMIGVPGMAASTPPRVITVGTSIEYGTGLNAGQSWPSRLADRAPGYVFTDMSKPGGAWTNKDEAGRTIRDNVNDAIAQHPDVLILGGPVNDLVTLGDITPLRQAVFEGVNAARNAGIRVLVMGIFPFNDGGAFQAGWWPSLEPRRTTYNSWASQMYGSDYIDLGWCLHETQTWRGDNRWFRDGLHPTRVGAALIAEVFPLERLN